METCQHFLKLPKVDREEKEDLERSFDEEEVLRCLKQCAIDKAPMLGGDER